MALPHQPRLEVLVDSVRRLIVARVRQHGLTFLRDALVIVLAYAFAETLRFDGLIPTDSLRRLIFALPVVVAVYSVANYMLGIHRRVWEYAGTRDLRALVDACLLSTVVIFFVDLPLQGIRPLPVSVVPAGGLLVLVGLCTVRLWSRLFTARERLSPMVASSRVLIVGAGQGGQLAAAELLANHEGHQYPTGFLDDDPAKDSKRIHGVPVLGTIDQLRSVVLEHEIDLIAIAIPSALTRELDRILDLAQATSARIQILPSRSDLMNAQGIGGLRDFHLNDLLDRVPLNTVLDDTLVHACVAGRTILVTGGAGSIGSELCRQLIHMSPAQVLALDNNEGGLYALERELDGKPDAHLLTTVLADVADDVGLARVFQRYGPEIVFHAAAYKHVPMLEAHPEEALHVNILGTFNVCQMAREYGCERFVFISTDKAVRPVSTLGFSKRIGEMLVRAHHGSGTAFCSVRFGNVIGSRGSALPEFVRQIDAGGPVTVTDPDVERYFMTIPEAVSLVIQAGAMAKDCELFMLDMGKPVKIADLVRRIIRLRGLRPGKDISIKYTGLRPGEKLTEDLTYDAERSDVTINPAIYAVQDDVQRDLGQLDNGITVLMDAVSRLDPDTLRTLLRAMAHGQDVSSYPYLDLEAVDAQHASVAG